MNGPFTKFDYLLNSMLDAGRHDKPADHGYAGKRQALYAHVRAMEAVVKVAEKAAQPRTTLYEQEQHAANMEALRSALAALEGKQ